MNKKTKTLTLIKFTFIALTLQVLSYSTRAAVNMRDASFLSQWKDFDLSTTDGLIRGTASKTRTQRFELIRYYNSRSYFIGYFGYGWCTDFEKKITVVSSEKILLHDCKLSAPVEYSIPPQSDPKAHIKLVSNKEELEFNAKGQLMAMKSPDSPSLVFSYDTSGKLKAIQASNLRRLEFEINSQLGLIKKVISKDGSKILGEATYEYENENLIAVKNGKVVAQNLQYDKVNNLTRIDEVLPSRKKQFEIVVYDESFDRVRKYKDSAGCIENFSYVSENSQNSSFASVVERRCNGQLTARATYRIKGEKTKIERSVATTESLK
jgi:hypothetical protein